MDPDPTASTSGTVASAAVDEILAKWLGALREGPDRAPPVRAGYGELGRLVLQEALRSDGSDATGAELTQEVEAVLEGALSRLAGASRRAGLSISATLADLGGLVPAMVSWLHRGADLSVGEDVRLRTVARVVLVVGLVQRRLVGILEASAARASEEDAEALAATTELMTHELRNRLGAAETTSRLLADPAVSLSDDGVRRAARLVHSSVEAAMRSLDDVHALMARRSDLRETSTRTVPLPALVDAVVEEARARSIESGVAIEQAETVDCLVDAPRLRLIVYNLVWNGVKYRDPTVARATVEVGARRRDDGTVELSVRDNGIGIASDDLADIFAFRVRRGDEAARPGSGLGLAIAREAAEQLGGDLSVSSEPGRGTTFTLTFRPERGVVSGP